jgi:hypothetical protein
MQRADHSTSRRTPELTGASEQPSIYRQSFDDESHSIEPPVENIKAISRIESIIKDKHQMKNQELY